jgi:hypothetical protein
MKGISSNFRPLSASPNAMMAKGGEKKLICSMEVLGSTALAGVSILQLFQKGEDRGVSIVGR